MDKKTTVQKKQSGVRIDPEILKGLKHLSIDLDRPLNSLFEEAAEDLIKKYKGMKKGSKLSS